MNNEHQYSDFSKTILNQLENQKVQPKSKWYFVIQEGGIWVLGIITTFCGAVAISSTLFVFTTAPLKFQPITHDSVLKFWLEFIPILWIILFISFVFATDYFLKKTKRGYRYGFVLLTISSIALSFFIGYLGFLIGLGEYFEERVGPRIPFHTPVHMMNQRMWSQPQNGMIIGTIVDTAPTLQTKEGRLFALDVSQLPQIQKNLVVQGTQIGIIGTTTQEDSFFVCIIVPFENKDFSMGPSFFERKEVSGRTNLCKGVRPYDRLINKTLNYENQ